MMIYIATGTHCAHPTVIRRYFGTYTAARDAAVDMVNLLRDHIGRNKLPSVPAHQWKEGLQEAQRERLSQMGDEWEGLDAETLAAQAECDVWIERATIADVIALTALDDRQLGTILAALRLLQRGPCPDDLTDIATDGGAVTALDPCEIDRLCEQLNGHGEPNDIPRIVVAIEGGLVSGVVTDRPVILHTVDYDTEGADDEDVSLVPQDAHDPVEAIVNHWSDAALTIDPDWIGRVEAAVTASSSD